MSLIEKLIKIGSLVLKPRKDQVRQYGSYIGLYQLLSPAITLYNMKRAGTSGDVPVIPFLFFTIFSSLNVIYADLQGDKTLYAANVAGFTFSFIYLTTYIYFVPRDKKKECFISILGGVLIVLGVYIYIKNVSAMEGIKRIEPIMQYTLYGFYTLSVLGVLIAIAKKSVSHFPLAMIIGGELNSMVRLSMALIAENKYHVIQNYIFVLINFAQIYCFFIYPSKKIATEDKKEENKKEDIKEEKKDDKKKDKKTKPKKE